MILVKFIAQSGILSRRKSEEAIKIGKVKVNGIIITDPTYEVCERDSVNCLNKKVTLVTFTYLLLNKPINYLTSKDDPSNMPLLMELLPPCFQSLDPVGRLDFNTSGLILLTNDGGLSYALSHPKFNVRKTYSIVASKPIDEEIIENLKRGIYLEDGMVQPDDIIWNAKNPKKLIITLHAGKYRIIRRLLETFFIFVKKLHRVQFATLTIKALPVGEWRHLSNKEIIDLKKFILRNKPTLKKASKKKNAL